MISDRQVRDVPGIESPKSFPICSMAPFLPTTLPDEPSLCVLNPRMSLTSYSTACWLPLSTRERCLSVAGSSGILSLLVWGLVESALACPVGCSVKKVEVQAVQEEWPPVPVTVAAVEVRDVQRRVSVVGSLRGFEQVTVTPKVEGRVVFTGFDVGDRIPPGTTLLELDDICAVFLGTDCIFDSASPLRIDCENATAESGAGDFDWNRHRIHIASG